MRSFCFFLLFLAITTGYGQTTSVKGSIKNEAGDGLPNISVLLKNAAGTTTDINGTFTLERLKPGTYILIISSIGYRTQQHTISLNAGEEKLLNLILSENTTELDEVAVVGETAGQEIKHSAKAVDVLEVKELKYQSADLAVVISKIAGVNIRRGGGLGSDARFSLNGLTDDQVRMFIDGVPIGFTGYSFGFANIPVNLVDRVEVYKGVLPINFGADALGGAVNIVTSKGSKGVHGSGSYQFGSFGINRLTASLSYYNDTTGFFSSLNGFLDVAKNNYRVSVPVADEKGREEIISTKRFHDAYEAKGVNAEFGFKNRTWAEELSLNVFYSDFDKELQNNNIMVVPYGGVTYGRTSYGTHLKYVQHLSINTSLHTVAGYSHSTIGFVDTSSYVFNWRGEKVARRTDPGEIGRATDQVLWENGGYARIDLEHRLNEKHLFRISLAPTLISRTGDERRQLNPVGRDALHAKNKLSYLVNGIEYEANLLDTRLQNILFGKQYLQQLDAHDVLPGNQIIDKNRNTAHYGFGNSLRYKISETVYSKLSYERTTRLPTPDEVFGDGALTLPNLDLEPEQSHNGNLEVNISNAPQAKARVEVSTNVFVRKVENQVILLGTDQLFRYQNVYGATSKGIELASRLRLLRETLTIEGNATYIDFRNTSSSGAFTKYDGDRIPNRPYLFGNASASYKLIDLVNEKDVLTFFWSGRYVHEFYRGWESDGLKQSKQIIPSQFIPDAGFTYQLPFKNISTFTFEVQNFTNAKAYDNFGVQKPGRVFYIKLTTKF